MREAENFIEQMGRHLEEEGVPRIAGRLMGALILNPEPCSLDDLAEQLRVSKASISSNARLLENWGIAERITVPGDRRDFYQLSPNAEERSLVRTLERHRLMLQRLEAGRTAIPDGNEVVTKRFNSLITFVGHAIEQLERAIACRKGQS